jgi:hypothetical protein
MIDLHMHSTCSDGTFRPADLVRRVREAGVTHMALTDHDTVEGLAEAAEAARTEGVRFLGGLEISAEFGPGTLHILGYGFDPADPRLLSRLTFVQKCRADRNPVIVERLNALGLEVTLEEIARRAGGDLVGRPHFAQTLLDKGYVQSRQEAFDRYLAKGQPAYADKVRLSPAESIEIIRGAGGVAVLAHPLQLKIEDHDALDAFVRDLKDLGLQGMECYYRNHTEEDEARFTALARKHSLLPTGGSDFHGANRPRIHLGVGEGRLKVPPECWEGLVGKGLGD